MIDVLLRNVEVHCVRMKPIVRIQGLVSVSIDIVKSEESRVEVPINFFYLLLCIEE